MLRVVVVATALLLLPACRPAATTSAAVPASAAAAATEPSPGYDAALAQRLGADEYGMRSYVMAFLRAGPTPPADAAQMRALMRGHLDNIERLAGAGVLVLAGPFADDGDLRGIYVFAVASVDEARKLTQTDPAIRSGALSMELHPWYGSAALGELRGIHERIAAEHP